MPQMPDDYDNENDGEVVNCYTTKEFREAIEKAPDDTMIYLRGEGQFRVPDVDRIPQQVTITDWARTYGAHINFEKNIMYVYKCVARNPETGVLETGRSHGHPVRAAMLSVQSGERHMLRCAIPADTTVIMSSGNSVKAPWADVVEEIEFDWRQVP